MVHLFLPAVVASALPRLPVGVSSVPKSEASWVRAIAGREISWGCLCIRAKPELVGRRERQDAGVVSASRPGPS